MTMKNRIFKILPVFLQEFAISLFNFLQYRIRYSKEYYKYLIEFKNNRGLSLTELKEIQARRFHNFLQYAKSKSKYYSDYPLVGVESISKLPILSKEHLRSNIDSFYTINKSKGVTSKTGGTTGKSLEVIFTKHNVQERFAMLDNFRANFGYKLGKRTAWFSGKDLITTRDIRKNIFWKYDRLYKTKYYSTFHIKEDYLKYYLEDILMFQPEYIVGFPSSILEIAKYGLSKGRSLPSGICKAVFPTAETISEEMRRDIGKFFNTQIWDQYSSSEGAPFIFECQNRKLHLELQSGIFEILDDENRSTNKGRLIVTSFTSEGCPLIRYDIGDMIEMEGDEVECNCGNNNPIVKTIDGRIDDYIFSIENGKINLGNVSNTLKDTNGIIKFQAIQNHIDIIDLKIVVDETSYNSKSERQFISNWKARVGEKTQLRIELVDSIANEKSGKYRIVKNNIKHLLHLEK